MKKIMLSLLIISSMRATAQQQKWQLGMHFSPSYNNLFINKATGFPRAISFYEARQAAVGISSGFLLNKKISKRWVFETGLTYSNRTDRVDNYILNYDGMMFITMPTIYSLSYSTVVHSVYAPLNALYFINEGKTKFFVQMGAAFVVNFLGASTFEIVKFNGEVEKQSYRSRFLNYQFGTIQTTAGFGVSRQVSDRFEIRATPTFHYFLNYKYSDKGVHPYSIGLNISAFIKL